MAVACASLHVSVSIHRQQMPAVVISALHVPAVRGELRSQHRPIRQINTAPDSLRFAQPAGVSVAVVRTPRKRSGDEAARWGHQDQLIVIVIVKSVQKGHPLSLLRNVSVIRSENRCGTAAGPSLGRRDWNALADGVSGQSLAISGQLNAMLGFDGSTCQLVLVPSTTVLIDLLPQNLKDPLG